MTTGEKHAMLGSSTSGIATNMRNTEELAQEVQEKTFSADELDDDYEDGSGDEDGFDDQD